MIQKNFLLPDDIAALIPAKGQKEFIIRAIKMAAGVGESPAPPPLKSEGKTAFVRDGRRYNPPLKPGLSNWKENGRIVYAPCLEAPHIDGRQAWLWQQYFEAWKWPDPFPGLVEWHSMGCPEKPLEVHRLPLEIRGEPEAAPAASDEPVTVEPVTVEPVTVEPVTVEPVNVALAPVTPCAILPDDI